MCSKKTALIILVLTLSPFILYYGGTLLFNGLAAGAQSVVNGESSLWASVIVNFGANQQTKKIIIIITPNYWYGSEYFIGDYWNYGNEANQLIQTGYAQVDNTAYQIVNRTRGYPRTVYTCGVTNEWEVETPDPCPTLGPLNPTISTDTWTGYNATVKTGEVTVNAELLFISINIFLIVFTPSAIYCTITQILKRKNKK